MLISAPLGQNIRLPYKVKLLYIVAWKRGHRVHRLASEGSSLPYLTHDRQESLAVAGKPLDAAINFDVCRCRLVVSYKFTYLPSRTMIILLFVINYSLDSVTVNILVCWVFNCIFFSFLSQSC